MMSSLRGLPRFPDSTDRTGRKLCFVVPGLTDASRHQLARFISFANLIARDGHEVDLAVWVPHRQPSQPVLDWLGGNCAAQIKLTCIPQPEPRLARGLLGLELCGAYNAYCWLAQRDFEAIYFFDQFGLAFHCLSAKKSGLEFLRQRLIVVADVPSLMDLEANKSPVEEAGCLVRYEMERKCFELADQLLMFNESVANWMTREGILFDPAKTAFELPCFLPGDKKESVDPLARIEQLVFWGDLSVRSGFPLFCAALGRMPTSLLAPLRLKVYCSCPDRAALKFAKRQFAALELEVSILTDRDFTTVIEDLCAIRSLVYAMDSTQQAGFEQLECLARNIPVISLDCAANRKVYAPEWQEFCLFEPRPAAVAAVASKALTGPAAAGLMSIDYADCREAWCRWQRQMTIESTTPVDCSQPRVTICLMHHERPRLVQQAIESIENQTYADIEVILLDDGSTSAGALNALEQIEERFSARGWRVLRQENRYLGAARNTAARQASGAYLFFLDDDNVLEPEAIETLVRVAQTSQSDIVGCFSFSFLGNGKPDSRTRIRCLIGHLGSGLEFGLFKNPFADSNSLISKSFFDSIHGNTEDYGVGKDDQEFYARALLAGAHMIVVPRPLYWARQLDTRLRHRHFNRYAGQWRVSQPYLAQMLPELRNIIRFSQSAFDRLYMEPITLRGIGLLAWRWLMTHLLDAARSALKYYRKVLSRRD